MVATFVERLSQGSQLDKTDVVALDSLCETTRDVPAKHYVSRHGDRGSAFPAFTEGWAARYQILRDGSRQITRVLLPGDACYFASDGDAGSSEEIVTLSACKIAFVKTNSFEALMSENPRISYAMHRLGRAETSILANSIVNVGRRDALERMAHLICEVFHRLRVVGQTDGNRFFFPLTQEDLADALGLTPVHTNRKLQQLRHEGLITLRSKELTILDEEGLARLAGFDATYLQSEIPGLAQDNLVDTNPLYG